jgi:hypothetical protein
MIFPGRMIRWFFRHLSGVRQHRINEASDGGTEGLIDLSLLFRDHRALVPTILSLRVNHRIGRLPRHWRETQYAPFAAFRAAIAYSLCATSPGGCPFAAN